MRCFLRERTSRLWFLSGNFADTPLQAEVCRSDPRACAEYLNQCLADPVSLEATQWSMLDVPRGAVPASGLTVDGLRGLSRSNTETPMHGRYTTILLNPTAATAFNDQILRDPGGYLDGAALPDGSVIVKWNFTSDVQPDPPQIEGEPWLTVMAKIDGYSHPTVGGSSVGGEWFYYLWRFGDFKQFDETPVYGKPQAFCTDCHNPVAKSDFVWNLHFYVRGREVPTFDDTDGARPDQSTSPVDLTDDLPPEWVCKEGFLEIGFEPPADVPIGPAFVSDPSAKQDMFDCFSWRTFLALNWPNDAAIRGEPNRQESLADLDPPRVWETFKETAEVFQPEVADWTIDDQDWNDEQPIPDACDSELSTMPDGNRAKVLRMISKTRAHQILNETHQAMGNQFNVLVDQDGRLVQYEVRFNRDEFEYLKANGFADTGSYSYQGPKRGAVFFPTNRTGLTGQGATEIKASWRELCRPDANGNCGEEEEDVAARYYTQVGLIYTPAGNSSPESCRLSKVGLVGLHVVRKTFRAPQWIWATFEHADNVPPAASPDAGQAAIASEAGRYLLWNPSCEAPSDEYCALMRPGALPRGLLTKLDALPTQGDPKLLPQRPVDHQRSSGRAR